MVSESECACWHATGFPCSFRADRIDVGRWTPCRIRGIGLANSALVEKQAHTLPTLKIGWQIATFFTMSQPVKLSDELVLDARLIGKVVKRSIAGQIEFWADLGRAVEPLLDGDRVLALQKAGKIKSLSDCLEAVDNP